MHAMKAPVVLAGSVLLLCFACLGHAAVPEQSISGTLMSQAGPFQCDQCLISLLANGLRPVNTTYLDLGGHFTFRGVTPGSYTIHIEIEGFEDVNQAVDVRDGFGLGANVTITLVRKATPSRTGGGNIVNIA